MWASHYDDSTLEGRHLANQRAWLAALPCPVLELQSTEPLPNLVDAVLEHLAAMQEMLADWTQVPS